MKLIVLGLPIGNIEDISLRALKRLQETKFLVCEDSRMFANLWSKLSQLNLVEGKFAGSIHFVNDFNEARVLPKLVMDMSLLEEAVLVSDAGMPLISDPGYKLVRTGLDLGWEVDVVPGPTAESAALAISGLPSDKYLFAGFLPKKPGKRDAEIKSLAEVAAKDKCSLIFYVSPHQLNKTLEAFLNIVGPHADVCVATDITKKTERIFRGKVDKAVEEFAKKSNKGEITVILSSRD